LEIQGMSVHFQEAAAAAANKATGAGSATTILGWATGSDFGMWIGILIGLIGLTINLYYRRKSDQRATLAHELYMQNHVMPVHTDSLPPGQDSDIARQVL
jgi:hypothetical protein